MKTKQIRIKIRPGLWLFLGVLSIAIVGCRPIQVQSKFGPASIAGFGTSFAWMPAATVVGDPLLSDQSLNQFIQETIQKQLEAKGYQLNSPPDGFWVTYRITSRRIVKDPYFNPKIYREGSLILITLDPKNKKLMWQGATSSIIDPSMPPSKRRQQIEKAIQAILAKLPDQGKK